MLLLNSFLFCGFVCLISQIILDNTKLTPGHITSILVITGAFLDTFSLYDKIIVHVGGGALVPITSFRHSLIHCALAKANSLGVMGILTATILGSRVCHAMGDSFGNQKTQNLVWLFASSSILGKIADASYSLRLDPWMYGFQKPIVFFTDDMTTLLNRCKEGKLDV